MYEIVITTYFKKQLKKIIKQDSELKEKLKKALKNFKKEVAIRIGAGVYKVRIARYGQGKSGGYRAYILLIEIRNILVPICIYAKNRKENLSFEELTWHVRKIKEELSNLL